MRTEKDIFGLVQLPDETLYGIHTYRAIKNFPSSGEKINPYLIKAYLQVKLAAAETNYRAEYSGKTNTNLLLKELKG